MVPFCSLQAAGTVRPRADDKSAGQGDSTGQGLTQTRCQTCPCPSPGSAAPWCRLPGLPPAVLSLVNALLCTSCPKVQSKAQAHLHLQALLALPVGQLCQAAHFRGLGRCQLHGTSLLSFPRTQTKLQEN